VVNVTSRLLFTPGKHPVHIVWEAGWTLGPVWTGAENFALTGISSPDCPPLSESQYRLNYPDSRYQKTKLIFLSEKVKVTRVQALRLCTGRTAHRGSRGIALLYRH
jgi:hypothetical protein